jgi:hypothetical protein
MADYETELFVDEQSLRIDVLRSGRVEEIVAFLSDLNLAYEAAYAFEMDLFRWSQIRRRVGRALPFEFDAFAIPTWYDPSPRSLIPEHRLKLHSIEIHSPGWIEVVGALNPLTQLREYLKDRHERSKDARYREEAERDRLRLENELLQSQLDERQTAQVRQRIEVLRSAGFSKSEIKQMTWERLGGPLSNLGRHQDSKLIGAPKESA